ncbi:hypothetical protein GCM10023097_78080 [Streptomyces collinus]
MGGSLHPHRVPGGLHSTGKLAERRYLRGALFACGHKRENGWVHKDNGLGVAGQDVGDGA